MESEYLSFIRAYRPECSEMYALRMWLSEKSIEWRNMSDHLIQRTHFEYNGKQISVIHGFGTYGGCIGANIKDEGLLEMRVGSGEPEGWLTADDVAEKLEGIS